MQDLLNEEDFITQKPYNPWKRFIVFYIIAFLNLFVLYLPMEFVKPPYDKFIGIPLFFLIPAMPFVMAFHKKDIAFTTSRIQIIGTCLLMVVYFIAYIILDVIENGIYFLLYTGYMTNFLILSGCVGYGLITSLIVIPLLRLRRKKILKTNAKPT